MQQKAFCVIYSDIQHSTWDAVSSATATLIAYNRNAKLNRFHFGNEIMTNAFGYLVYGVKSKYLHSTGVLAKSGRHTSSQ